MESFHHEYGVNNYENGVEFWFELSDKIEEGTSDMIAIIDYDAGNIKSVEKALQKLGQGVVITREKSRF